MTAHDQRLHDLHVEHGDEALSESLRLQRTVRDRFASRDGKRGKRRKGDVVIDLNAPGAEVPRRSRIPLVLLWVEAVIAIVALSVLVAYMVSQRETLF